MLQCCGNVPKIERIRGDNPRWVAFPNMSLGETCESNMSSMKFGFEKSKLIYVASGNLVGLFPINRTSKIKQESLCRCKFFWHQLFFEDLHQKLEVFRPLKTISGQLKVQSRKRKDERSDAKHSLSEECKLSKILKFYIFKEF